jgi:hypothetical protein
LSYTCQCSDISVRSISFTDVVVIYFLYVLASVFVVHLFLSKIIWHQLLWQADELRPQTHFYAFHVWCLLCLLFI